MLLSLSRRFIFVANLKSASSSIERAVGRYAEFKVSETRFGKHDTLSAISNKFNWVRKYVPYEDFFVFGVIRDPVDFVLSLYNFHNLDGFDGKPHSAKGVPFDEFWNGWCKRSWQAKPQHERFSDRHGRFRVSHIIDFADLSSEFPKVCGRLGVEATLALTNKSPQVLTRNDLLERHLREITAHYAADYDFIQNRPKSL